MRGKCGGGRWRGGECDHSKAIALVRGRESGGIEGEGRGRGREGRGRVTASRLWGSLHLPSCMPLYILAPHTSPFFSPLLPAPRYTRSRHASSTAASSASEWSGARGQRGELHHLPGSHSAVELPVCHRC